MVQIRLTILQTNSYTPRERKRIRRIFFSLPFYRVLLITLKIIMHVFVYVRNHFFSSFLNFKSDYKYILTVGNKCLHWAFIKVYEVRKCRFIGTHCGLIVKRINCSNLYIYNSSRACKTFSFVYIIMCFNNWHWLIFIDFVKIIANIKVPFIHIYTQSK